MACIHPRISTRLAQVLQADISSLDRAAMGAGLAESPSKLGKVT